MMNRSTSFVLMLLLPLQLAVGQQNSKLPQCPEPPTGYWDNCIGTRTFPNGNIYVGEFHNNTFNGQGRLRYSDGSTYIGEFRDGSLDGHGASTFANGGTHVGEVHNNKANGPGIKTFADGDIYNGEFRDSSANGNGTLTHPNGDKYVGEFRDDAANGQGTYIFANGTRLVGEFKDGHYAGPPRGTVPPAKGTLSPSEVSLEKQGGVLLVPVLINDKIPLDFIIDSGASDVTLPADVVSTLMRTGTLSSSDFTGTKIYVLADGSQVPSQTFLIRSLKVGDLVLNNVAASVASANGPLLLGQTFLGRFKSWSIDNVRQILVVGQKTF